MKIDEGFNSMIYDSILPCIAKAFASLEKGATLNRLEFPNEINPQIAITDKARQMKLVINNFIDGQVQTMDNLFKE